MTTVTTPVSFSFHETHDVRIQVIDGEPWFCLKDVCEVLTIANPRRVAAEILDSKGVRKTDTPTNGGQQQISFINEPNLYRVIFRSNKPEAKQFQDWVFNEVLPAIRKTGRYERPAAQSNELTAKDMLNLKHLIHIMTGQFRYKQAWSSGVWHCLRKMTGVKSPHSFSISDLPEMADEIRRIMRITCAANRFIADMETEMIKRVIRRNEEVEPFLEEMRQEFLEVMRKEHAGLLALEKFESKCIENFRNRLN